MINQPFIISMLAAALLVFSGHTLAADQQEFYVGPLVTQQESREHHEKIRNARTADERHQLQKEYHELMRARANARRANFRKISDERRKSADDRMRGGEASGDSAGSGGGQNR